MAGIVDMGLLETGFEIHALRNLEPVSSFLSFLFFSFLFFSFLFFSFLFFSFLFFCEVLLVGLFLTKYF